MSKDGNQRGPNVLLVTIDCMRRDRVSSYGYERQTTPFLDRLLDRALDCTSAHASSSWTCPSVISLLTGLYPHHHGGGIVPGEPKNLSKRNLPTTLPKDVPTIGDVLAARGYATAAIGAVWNAHLSIPGRFRHMAMVEKPARRLVKLAMRWMKAQPGPFFLWLHLGDAHEPLDVPRSLRNVFGRVPRVPKVRRWDYTTSRSAVGSPEFHRYRDARIRLYDAAVRSADESLASLWDGLGAMGQRDRTLLVVTSDHGEEFWEHREDEMASFTDPRDVFGTGHGHNLFQVHLLVPLVVAGPGITAGVEAANVSSVDVLPTLLQGAGAESPPTDGVSLLEGPVDAERAVVSEGIAYGHEKKSVVQGDFKLLSCPGDGYERVFALRPDDRREQAVSADPQVQERLRASLPGEPVRLGDQVRGTEEIEAHLRDLGYIE